MDEKTEMLIRELAHKLGTTREYLWKVMVKQGPISGFTNVLVFIAWTVFSVWLLRITARKVEASEWDGIAWLAWFVIVGLLTIIAGTCMSGVIGSIINPEYWALKKLLP